MLPFDTAVQEALRNFGLLESQIVALQPVVQTISLYLHAPALNDVKEPLERVAKLSCELARTLHSLARPEDPAHAAASVCLGREMVDNEAFARRLLALAQEATEGLAALDGRKATRHKIGQEGAWLVGEIDTALRQNWPTGEPYPDNLHPHSLGRRSGPSFYDVVGICFEAAGYRHVPKRALEAYVKLWRASGSDLTIGGRERVFEEVRADVAKAVARELAFPRTSKKR